MSAILCLITWNVAIGPAELHPVLGVLDGERERRVARPDELGAQRDGDVVDDAPQQRASGRPAGRRGAPAGRSRLEAGHLAGEVRASARARRRAPRSGTCPGRRRCGRRRGPSRRCGRRARPACARRAPRRRRADGAVVRDPSTGSPCAELLERERARRAPDARSPQQLGRPSRPRRERREHRRREERAGERQPAHLLEHDDDVDEPEPSAAVRLGDEQPGPAELGDLAPTARR